MPLSNREGSGCSCRSLLSSTLLTNLLKGRRVAAIRCRCGIPNQTKADSQAGSRIWGVFVNSVCFSRKNKEDSQKSVQFANLVFLWILLVFPLRIHKNTPNSRTVLQIGISLVWFAGATPEASCCSMFRRVSSASSGLLCAGFKVLECCAHDAPCEVSQCLVPARISVSISRKRQLALRAAACVSLYISCCHCLWPCEEDQPVMRQVCWLAAPDENSCALWSIYNLGTEKVPQRNCATKIWPNVRWTFWCDLPQNPCFTG